MRIRCNTMLMSLHTAALPANRLYSECSKRLATLPSAVCWRRVPRLTRLAHVPKRMRVEISYRIANDLYSAIPRMEERPTLVVAAALRRLRLTRAPLRQRHQPFQILDKSQQMRLLSVNGLPTGPQVRRTSKNALPGSCGIVRPTHLA